MGAEKAALDLDINAPGAKKTMSELKKEIRDLSNELTLCEEGSERWYQILRKIGSTKDTIGDLKEQIRSVEDAGSKMTALVNVGQSIAGAFSIATGSAALFGAENKKVQEWLMKVQAATSILQGVQAVAESEKHIGILKSIFLLKGKAAAEVTATNATKGAIVMQRILNAVTNAWPIALVLAGITALVAAVAWLVTGTDEAAEAAEALNEQMEKQAELSKEAGERAVVLAEEQVKLAKARGVAEKELHALEMKAAEEKLNAVKKQIIANKALIEEKFNSLQYLDDEERESRRKEIEDLGKNSRQLLLEQKKLTDDLLVLDLNYHKEKNKQAEEAGKKWLEGEKNLLKQLQDAKIANVKDDEQREIMRIRLDLDRKKEEISNAAGSKKTKDALLAELEEKHQADLLTINKKYQEKSEEIAAKDVQKFIEDEQRLLKIKEGFLQLDINNLEGQQEQTVNKIKEATAIKIQLADVERIALLTSDELTAEERVLIQKQYEEKVRQIKEEGAKKQKDLNDKELQEHYKLLANKAEAAAQYANTLGSINQLVSDVEIGMGKKTADEKIKVQREYAKRKKVIDIGEAIISGGKVILNALQMQPFFPLGLASAISAGATVAAQISKIVNAPLGDGGGGGGGSTQGANVTPPQLSYTSQPTTQLSTGAGQGNTGQPNAQRVVLVAGDVKKTDQRVSVIESMATY